MLMEQEQEVKAAALQDIAARVAPGAGWAAHQAACRALDELGSESLPETRQARIALLGSATLDPLVAFLRIEAARAGIWAEVYLAPYGQYVQEMLRPESELYQFGPHATFVAVEGEVLWEMRWSSAGAGDGIARADVLVDSLIAGLDAFRTGGTGVVVVNDLALPHPSSEGVHAFRSPNSLVRGLGHANQRLAEELARQGSTFVFPLADLIAEMGRSRAFNRRMHYRGHVTWSDALMREVARRYAWLTAAARGHATKCVVLDLDNTLWGGVLGEDGAAGIAIGTQWPGREFLDFQRQLLELHRQGILLAVCSKNNEDEALAALRDHPELLIREEHLAAHRINWQDKASNIRELASELNIGLDHMLFLDDSPHEREWVRREIPELLVPELPADPTEYAAWIGTLPSLVVLQQTAEDANRTQRYKEERTRERFRQRASDPEDFLRDLQLRVAIEPVSEATLPRVAQLLAKTNQFNLTTRRHDEATIRRHAESGVWRVYAMRVADRFGDFGLTGVAIAVPDGKIWHIDSFLLSCRVIGKSVESALLAAIASDARAAGARCLTAEFLPSGRNAPARDLLPRHGFAPEGERMWTRSLETPGPQLPEWIDDSQPT